MTPKEKAEDLIDKFIAYSYDGISSARDNAIECALISVKEIIKELDSLLTVKTRIYIESKFQFWIEVLQELEKL